MKAKTEEEQPRGPTSFTLVELLVVVAVIAILASLLMPALRTARENAWGIACLNNVRQVTTSINLYRNDHGDSIPSDAGVDSLGDFDFRTALISNNYLPSELRCPLSKTRPNESKSGYRYGMNDNLRKWFARLTNLRVPLEKTILVAENYVIAPYSMTHYERTVSGWSSGSVGNTYRPQNHRGGIYCGMADGHVEWLPSYNGQWDGTTPLLGGVNGLPGNSGYFYSWTQPEMKP